MSTFARRRTASNGRSTSSHRPKELSSDYDPPLPTALNPFYSFRSHWTYFTQQYLCLSSWGTCVGGINEQYDDIMEMEASMPLVEENYRHDLRKWKQQQHHRQSQHSLVSSYSHSKPSNYQTAESQQSSKSKMTQITETNEIPQIPRRFSMEHQCPEYRYIPSSESPKPDPPDSAPKPSDTLNLQNSVNITSSDDTQESFVLVPSKIPLHRPPREEMKGRSFGRKMDFFQKSVEEKQRQNEQQIKWEKQHRIDHNQDKRHSFKPMDRDGVQYLDAFSASPAAHGVKQVMHKQVSIEEHSNHMKAMEDPDAVVLKDEKSAKSLSDKINAFQRLSASGGSLNIDL